MKRVIIRESSFLNTTPLQLAVETHQSGDAAAQDTENHDHPKYRAFLERVIPNSRLAFITEKFVASAPPRIESVGQLEFNFIDPNRMPDRADRIRAVQAYIDDAVTRGSSGNYVSRRWRKLVVASEFLKLLQDPNSNLSEGLSALHTKAINEIKVKQNSLGFVDGTLGELLVGYACEESEEFARLHNAALAADVGKRVSNSY